MVLDYFLDNGLSPVGISDLAHDMLDRYYLLQVTNPF